MPKTPASAGPLLSGIFAAAFAGGLLIALAVGMKLTIFTLLAVVVPVMAIAVTLVAVSMGWIFIAVGRLKQPPRALSGTIAAIAVAMVELLILIVICGKAGGSAGGF